MSPSITFDNFVADVDVGIAFYFILFLGLLDALRSWCFDMHVPISRVIRLT